MPRLIKSVVDKIAIPPPDIKQQLYRDSTLPGFGLRVGSGGTKTFFAETRIKGRVKRITLGRFGHLTCEQARKEAQKFLGQVASGGDPITEKKEANAL